MAILTVVTKDGGERSFIAEKTTDAVISVTNCNLGETAKVNAARNLLGLEQKPMKYLVFPFLLFVGS